MFPRQTRRVVLRSPTQDEIGALCMAARCASESGEVTYIPRPQLLSGGSGGCLEPLPEHFVVALMLVQGGIDPAARLLTCPADSDFLVQLNGGD
jgi:hypothetical protein